MAICKFCLNSDVDNDDCIIPFESRYKRNNNLPDDYKCFEYHENNPIDGCYFYIFDSNKQMR